MAERNCPLCLAPLSSFAEADGAGRVTLVADCPNCGRYVLPSDVAELLPYTEAADRANASKAVRARQHPDGVEPVRVTAEDFVRVEGLEIEVTEPE